ncbi:hypothetical protein [Actinoalloteichus fjordicus]|uniref:Uncharacterized protein n=1 Tax=Actinoalloteichus fjordicus TaxID=1612552 RepID=A0AAC9LF73_9PSEU|nr:hypothetical protein [Actinoalloteichus fjordicus]APU16576.1 hypothetical protein UA74_22790 [Actinoalloteichus fjordicus]
MGKKVLLLAGFVQGPFFYHDQDGDWMNHLVDEAGEDLGLSAELVADLTRWDEEYQDIYDSGHPPDSAFPTAEAKLAWTERGRALAARIKQESSIAVEVDYQANGSIPEGTCVF